MAEESEGAFRWNITRHRAPGGRAAPEPTCVRDDAGLRDASLGPAACATIRLCASSRTSTRRSTTRHYRSATWRVPTRPFVVLPGRVDDLANPLYGEEEIGELDNDLTRQHRGEPLGERIIVTGRLLEENGRPVPSSLIEIWQPNAAGRYRHKGDQHPAPLDPNFTGAGRTLTGADGRYEFITVKPGAYPWKNHPNAWRPAHIHFSVFGRAFSSRLVTQMYFPGDPLHDQDPILQSVRDPHARKRLVADFELELTQPDWALGYRFDIVLRQTPLE